MALPIETPSRIWRRIEEGEAQLGDMPSLPSLPGFDDTDDTESTETLPCPQIPTPDRRQDAEADNTIQSTASSHDLTVHLRANASFDPITGSLGVGRFNAGKLNTYLHSLNRKLQEENKQLMEKLLSTQECRKGMEPIPPDSQHSELSGVVEDDRAEQWMAEKEELEKKIQGLQCSVDTLARKLEKEQKDRSRDRERWKVMMTEAEQGIGDIVKDLEKRAIDAEEKVVALEGLDEKLRNLEVEFSQARAKAEALEHSTEQREQETNELKSKLLQERKEIDRLLEERDREEQRAELAEQRVNEAKELRLELASIREDANNFCRVLGQLRDENENYATQNKLIVEEKECLERILKQLRDEKSHLAAQHKLEIERYRAQLGVLEDKLASQAEKQKESDLLHQSIDALRSKHNKECKGLLVHIRYLKAKFAREAAFRASMSYQKKHLLEQLSRYAKSEKHISATIARIGISGYLNSHNTPKKLKSYILAIMFVQRARRESQQWREQQVDKDAVTEAYQNLTSNRTHKK